MTTLILRSIRELHGKGLTNTEICRQTGLSPGVVSTWLRNMGLKRNGTERTATARYCIYGPDGEFWTQGTAAECAKYLGVKVNTIYHAANRTKHGAIKKYTVVKDGEMGGSTWMTSNAPS